MDRKAAKPGNAQSRVTKHFACAQFVTASLNSRWMVVGNPQAPSSVRCGSRGTIAQSDYALHFSAAEGFHHCVRGFFRGLKMNGDGLIAPGVFELMAAIRHIDDLHAQIARHFFEAARLVTELCSEQ